MFLSINISIYHGFVFKFWSALKSWMNATPVQPAYEELREASYPALSLALSASVRGWYISASVSGEQMG